MTTEFPEPGVQLLNQPGQPVNHQEARELALMKRAESNLARCYLEFTEPRPISAVLYGPPGLYGTGDPRNPDAMVPVFKDHRGRIWSMTLDTPMVPEGWHADAVVYGGPIMPPAWRKG